MTLRTISRFLSADVEIQVSMHVTSGAENYCPVCVRKSYRPEPDDRHGANGRESDGCVRCAIGIPPNSPAPMIARPRNQSAPFGPDWAARSSAAGGLDGVRCFFRSRRTCEAFF